MRSLLYIVYLPASSSDQFISKAKIFAKVKLRLQAYHVFFRVNTVILNTLESHSVKVTRNTFTAC